MSSDYLDSVVLRHAPPIGAAAVVRDLIEGAVAAFKKGLELRPGRRWLRAYDSKDCF